MTPGVYYSQARLEQRKIPTMRLACKFGHLDVRNVTDGGTPLDAAYKSGHFEIARWLFGAGEEEVIRIRDD